MDESYRCPECTQMRDHPGAYCDACDYSPDPRVDQEPAGASPDLTRRVLEAMASGAITAIGVLMVLVFIAIACGGLVLDNRVVDRAILRLEGR